MSLLGEDMDDQVRSRILPRRFSVLDSIPEVDELSYQIAEGSSQY